MSRAGGQSLAIDTPSSPNLQRLSTAELRAERDRLRCQLDQAPRDRGPELARAITHREQADAAAGLTPHEDETIECLIVSRTWTRPSARALLRGRGNRRSERASSLRPA